MAKYQKFTPGEYFDWEQPMVQERMDAFAAYEKKPGGELFEEKVLTEEEQALVEIIKRHVAAL